MSAILFDIETTSLPIAELKEAIPPFDEEGVKYGNAKDPEKRAKILADAREAHTINFIENAALDPRTGRAKLAGFRDCQTGDIFIHVWEANARIVQALIEAEIDSEQPVVIIPHETYSGFLAAVLMRLTAAIVDGELFGYSIHDFDLPFIFKAAWMNGIAVAVRKFRRGRYWKDNVVDLRDVFNFGERYEGHGGVEGLSKLLNTKNRKTGDGKKFGALYEADPIAGVRYLIADLLTEEDIGRAMGEI